MFSEVRSKISSFPDAGFYLIFPFPTYYFVNHIAESGNASKCTQGYLHSTHVLCTIFLIHQNKTLNISGQEWEALKKVGHKIGYYLLDPLY